MGVRRCRWEVCGVGYVTWYGIKCVEQYLCGRLCVCVVQYVYDYSNRLPFSKIIV